MNNEKILNAITPIVNARKTHKDDNLYRLQLNSYQLDMLQGLLDLYNKEKEKNKELFEEYNKRVATIIKHEQGINEIIDKIYEEYTDISEVVEDLEKLLKRE